jgi:hypothetical protein
MYIVCVDEDNSESPGRVLMSRKRMTPSPHPPPSSTKKRAENYENESHHNQRRQIQQKRDDEDKTPLVFLCSGLDHDEKVLVEECQDVLGATIVSEWTPQVSHVIVKCVHVSGARTKLQLPTQKTAIKRWVKIRSMKYLKGIVAGRWVVSDAWIRGTFSVMKQTYDWTRIIHIV